MSPEHEPQPQQSKEYLEQVAIEHISRTRYPDAVGVKEILPGFQTDETNYVWLVVMDTGKPFENILTFVGTQDILKYQQEQKPEPLL